MIDPIWHSSLPTLYGTSVFGSIGCFVAVLMGVRLLVAIQHTGGTEERSR